MELQFLGGAREVGRSGVFLKDSKNILLDYGIKVDGKTEYPLHPGRVDAYILSHAHLDHGGDSPALYSYGNPVAFGTEPTLRLAQLLIEDSMEITRRRHARKPFSKKDYSRFVSSYIPHAYGSSIELGEYSITFHDAGHISGSSITAIEKASTGRRLVYTGDFKLSAQLLHNGAETVKSDILVTESTYATREHPDRNDLIKLFMDNVKRIIDNKGVALIPAFAVGRSQEILAIIQKNRLIDYTFVDGMARKATSIALQYPNFLQNANMLKSAVEKATLIASPHEREEALRGGSIIVTTAGMLTGGPVLNYITKLNNRSMIFLTGYQAENTNGRRLLEEQPLIIDGERHFIRTPFAFYDLSAHAGQGDLYDYVKRSAPEKVVCVHGDAESTTAFKDQLELEGFEAYAPKVGDRIRLDF